jgi:hypothetical protein
MQISKFILIIGLLSSFLPSLAANTSSQPSSIVASDEKSYAQQLSQHWLELAKLYEASGFSQLASIATSHATALAALPMPEPVLTNPSVTSPEENATITLDVGLTELVLTYLNSWFVQDIESILAVTTPGLLLPSYANGLSKTEQAAFFLEFFGTYPELSTLELSDIYDLESIELTHFDASKAMLSMRSRTSAPQSLSDWNYWSSFWNNLHHYFFQKMADGKWYILAFDMDEYPSSYPMRDAGRP